MGFCVKCCKCNCTLTHENNAHITIHKTLKELLRGNLTEYLFDSEVLCDICYLSGNQQKDVVEKPTEKEEPLPEKEEPAATKESAIEENSVPKEEPESKSVVKPKTDKNAILVLRAQGVSAKDVAAKVGVHVSTVHKVVADYRATPYDVPGYGFLVIQNDRGRRSHPTQEKKSEPVKEVEASEEITAVKPEPRKAATGTKSIEVIKIATPTSEDEMSAKQRILRMNAQNVPVHQIARKLSIDTAQVNKVIECHMGDFYNKLNDKYNIKSAATIYALHRAKWNPDLIASEVHEDVSTVVKVIREFRNV